MTQITENEPGIVWCQPWGEGQGDYVRVAVADFDPEFHMAIDDKPAEDAPKRRGRPPKSED